MATVPGGGGGGSGGSRKPRPRPRPKPKPKPKKKPPPQPATTGGSTTNTTADHSTLDVAAMGTPAGTAPPLETDVTTVGGPVDEGAVFSTGAGAAQQLRYDQMTTYQEVYAQQLGGATGQTGAAQ